MKILIIIPAYNESENIPSLLQELNACEKCEYDILVVNDYSKDNTSIICRNFNVEVIDLPCNLGIGGAVQTGYKYATQNNYDFAVQVDGDGQHNPTYISELLKPLINQTADLVIGSRYLKREGFQSTILRRIGIRYFTNLIYILTKNKITDPTSGFRACNSKVIDLFSNNYPQDYPEPESIVYLLRNKMRVLEVPVIMNERKNGISSINPIRSIYYMIKVTLAVFIDFLRKKDGRLDF